MANSQTCPHTDHYSNLEGQKRTIAWQFSDCNDNFVTLVIYLNKIISITAHPYIYAHWLLQTGLHKKKLK